MDELDSPEKERVKKHMEEKWMTPLKSLSEKNKVEKSQNSPHNLTDEDLALPFC